MLIIRQERFAHLLPGAGGNSHLRVTWRWLRRQGRPATTYVVRVRNRSNHATVEDALQRASQLLQRARKAGIPIFHIQHDAGVGSPYDLTATNGQIADVVAPADAEAVIVKRYRHRGAMTFNTATDGAVKFMIMDAEEVRIHRARVDRPRIWRSTSS